MKNIFRFSVIFSVLGLLSGIVDAAQSPNPRSGNNNTKRTETSVSQDSGVQSRRAASSVIARSMKVRARNKVVTNGSVVSRSAAVRNKVSKSANINTARTATNTSKIVRSAMNMNKVRSATSPNNYGKRSARATAIYGDESKMGAGYASCKTAYATCMDQFCGKANETYRRCYCSDRFRNFRDTEEALDSALSMLADFQNNNLDAVTKTAAEVGAMYSASEGEAAIKKDTSASQKLLDSIGDLLSGKKSSKKSSAPKTNSNRLFDIGSLNISSVSTSLDDIWGGGSSDGGLFASSSSATNDLTELDGKDLYNEVNQQCISVVRGSCENDAMFNLAKSSYSVLISQDCNLYEKQIDTKKKSVEDTVRAAEKYLREARLEEYRAHNSADVNECLDKVTKAILMETACGENYHKCLDYSGMYINLTTGEPIYSKALFGLNKIIELDGSSDVLRANPKFNDFLETKQMFVTTALDSCRSIADTVWTEFKRSALIQIAQAQDEKLEEV
ncbi:MAG: hypothetical protein MJ158_03980, partial [Alphaproteobacteria bacterium]|nr:hypothetical protein [Alphaproteobacteria bacterium]